MSRCRPRLVSWGASAPLGPHPSGQQLFAHVGGPNFALYVVILVLPGRGASQRALPSDTRRVGGVLGVASGRYDVYEIMDNTRRGPHLGAVV